MVGIDLIMVCGISLLVGIWFAWATRKAPFLSLGGDNQKQVYAAAQLKIPGWPSRMHRYCGGKAFMKDVSVLGLALLQRLFKDRTSVYPLLTLCNISVSISTVLLYCIASTYWNTNIGILVALLFLFCFWPHQISLMGGFHCLAQVFLLVSVVFLQISEWATTPYSFICYWLAGVTGAMIVFTSASGRKFLPLWVGAFLYSQRAVIHPLEFTVAGWGSLLEGFGFFLFSLFFIVLAGLLLSLLSIVFLYEPMMTRAYHKGGPPWLHRMIKSRDRYPLERYLKLRGRILAFGARWGLKVVCYFLISLFLSRDPSFYGAQLLVMGGAGMIVFLLTYPNMIENLRGYLTYHYTTYKFSRFDEYAEYFKRIGRPIPKDKRGAGISWIIHFMPRMIPFHVAYFLIALFLSLLVLSSHGFEPSFLWDTIAILGLSLSPLIYAEWTKAPQSSRAYFPALIGVLLLVAYGCFQWEQILAPESKILFWFVVVGATLLSIGWNIWVFFNDVFPGRMLVLNLIKRLQKLGIRKFYTYNTKYNDVLVNFIPPEMRKEYQINFIESLKEVKEGYVIVPGVSSKSWNFEAYECGIKGQDFDKDPLLTELIDTKEIQDFSIASFKTLGTSKIWINESEITTYRNYIVKDITNLDRWRSQVWIVDGGKLHAYRRGEAV